ncbi:MAG TPA: lanthionine synthetase LanC family protein [Marmoricola sp.]
MSAAHRETAEAAWRWVLAQVRHDAAGPWVPEAATDPPATEPSWDRDGMHSGIGGLAHVLAEIRLHRPWMPEEQALAKEIGLRLRKTIATQTDCTFFDGLVSAIGVLVALDEPGAEDAVARLADLAEADGWPSTALDGDDRYLPGARINDLTLGTAGVLAGAVWAARNGVSGAERLAATAADVLLDEAVRVGSALDWPFVPDRFLADPPGARMPNLSHGVAGIAAALAVAGAALDRSDLVEAARQGAEHLVSLGNTGAGGLVVPRLVPPKRGDDEVTYTWCHGPTGTSLLFPALAVAGVQDVAGEPPDAWQRRCLHSVRTSGIPMRLRPGFWDNDGRCCGTAGVGDVFLDAYHRSGFDDDRAFALSLADTLVDRAIVDDRGARWRFLEHRDPEPLLAPGLGWMQGASGIAAFLFHAARVAEHGREAPAVARTDTWWAVPHELP